MFGHGKVLYNCFEKRTNLECGQTDIHAIIVNLKNPLFLSYLQNKMVSVEALGP